jgi:hypothetical protein
MRCRSTECMHSAHLYTWNQLCLWLQCVIDNGNIGRIHETRPNVSPSDTFYFHVHCNAHYLFIILDASTHTWRFLIRTLLISDKNDDISVCISVRRLCSSSPALVSCCNIPQQSAFDTLDDITAVSWTIACTARDWAIPPTYCLFKLTKSCQRALQLSHRISYSVAERKYSITLKMTSMLIDACNYDPHVEDLEGGRGQSVNSRNIPNNSLCSGTDVYGDKACEII